MSNSVRAGGVHDSEIGISKYSFGRFGPGGRWKACFNMVHYYLATIVRALWLAAKGALFSCICDDRALSHRCPKHIQSVFNLIVDLLMGIHIMANFELSKRVSADQCYMLKWTTHLGDVFLKLSADNWANKISQHPGSPSGQCLSSSLHIVIFTKIIIWYADFM